MHRYPLRSGQVASKVLTSLNRPSSPGLHHDPSTNTNGTMIKQERDRDQTLVTPVVVKREHGDVQYGHQHYLPSHYQPPYSQWPTAVNDAYLHQTTPGPYHVPHRTQQIPQAPGAYQLNHHSQEIISGPYQVHHQHSQQIAPLGPYQVRHHSQHPSQQWPTINQGQHTQEMAPSFLSIKQEPQPWSTIQQEPHPAVPQPLMATIKQEHKSDTPGHSSATYDTPVPRFGVTRELYDIEDLMKTVPDSEVSIGDIRFELENGWDGQNREKWTGRTDQTWLEPSGSKKIKQEYTPVKVKLEGGNHDDNDYEGWDPPLWQEQYENIRKMRANREAPVDKYGCFMNAETDVLPEVRRYQILISLMLSSQTKDEIVGKAMTKLKKNGLTVQSILDTPEEEVARMIHPVGFWNKKAKYIKRTTEIISTKFGSDIPNSAEGLVSLPGIGPKMAHLIMDFAWKETTGVAVDTHVHRITHRLGWMKKELKNPEKVRTALETWFPKSEWSDLNLLFVGFGQTICSPVTAKCDQCLNKNICPSSNSRDPDAQPVQLGIGIELTTRSKAPKKPAKGRRQ